MRLHDLLIENTALGFDLNAFVAEINTYDTLYDEWYSPAAAIYQDAIGEPDAYADQATLATDEFQDWYRTHHSVMADALTVLIRQKLTDLRASLFRNGWARLYRMMRLPYDPVPALVGGKRDLGIHWAYVKTACEFDYGSTGYEDTQPATQPPRHYLFTVEVPLTSVDWKTTAFHYVAMEDFEKEIVLLRGAPVTLLSVEQVPRYREPGMPLALGNVQGKIFNA